mmetsp:Transcript_13980/g.20707  ORF Transcript_13980/g.20707 Transcript_13980/m.20707 type:complete len:100 (+) Transcript_13980:97-396(+)|eukprot:CAMPEP_0171463200 /NCGR_PEP_ID=MMETSP0945-20130129/6952_1 /TAXON_ID=109269 /ORGANISM="Vaucheria litorea, Strain CCMP2940" /LENGTH=99 /DNA_ID=CAMNT_0011989917 /DNA_START=91 /DNA_END=390 /DNA_ORIENTATION=-
MAEASPAQQKLIEIAEMVQEQLTKIWGNVKEIEQVKSALEQIDEMIAGPKKQFDEAVEQLREALQGVLGSSAGKSLGLSKEDTKTIEETPEEEEEEDEE